MKCRNIIVALCVILALSYVFFPIKAYETNIFTSIATSMAFTSETQFTIPTTNGTICFNETGYYSNATLVDDTWVFTHLQLDPQHADILSDSPTTANLNITTQDSNITITSFERLLTPDGSDNQNRGSWLTEGWLNYTVAGIGEQIIRIRFNLANWTEPSQDTINGTFTWPLGVEVCIDGKQADYNTSSLNFTDGVIPYGTGLIVEGATSNVSIKYAWAPVPAPVDQSLIDSSLSTTKASISPVWLPYLLLVAMASAVIVSVALFTNRHRLKLMLNKKKGKQYLEVEKHAKNS